MAGVAATILRSACAKYCEAVSHCGVCAPWAISLSTCALEKWGSFSHVPTGVDEYWENSQLYGELYCAWKYSGVMDGAVLACASCDTNVGQASATTLTVMPSGCRSLSNSSPSRRSSSRPVT